MHDQGSLKGIKDWAAQDRPREKLLAKGKESLSDAEILAILIGSGSRNESAVDLSKRILSSVSNNLLDLGQKDVVDLMKFKGIGEAKAISIVAAMELGRRRQQSNPQKEIIINSSAEAYRILGPRLMDLSVEEFWILILNRRNKVVGQKRISQGGVSATVVDSKLVFKPILDQLASGVILFHNHPSGQLQPSKADKELTQKLYNVGKQLDINVLDHIIVAGSGYFSFKDEGLL